MKTVCSAVGAVVAMLLGPASASAALLQEFKYDAGTLKPPWQGVQEPAPGRLSVVPSPTDPTTNVMRVELRHGDVFNTGSGAANRSEVYGRRPTGGGTWPDGDGTERWYGWSTYFEPGFPVVSNWAVITQWHHDNGNPPLAIAVHNGYIELNHRGAELWRSATPAATGVWHRFVAHMKWSPLSAVGFVELWHNGVQVVPKTFLETEDWCLQGLPPQPCPNYLKMGIYRDAATIPPAVLYHGSMKVGTDMSSVLP